METAGFKRTTEQNVQLTAPGPTAVNITLQPGSMNETVSIKGTAPVVENQSAEMNLGLGTREVRELPVIERNHQQLNQLQTGITPPLAVLPLAADPPRNRFFSTNGQRPDVNLHNLDGVLNMEPYRGTAARVVPEESVQQMNIVTASKDTAHGWTPGAWSNIVTRGGTNTWHGSLYEFWSGDILQSRSLFNTSPYDKPRYIHNQFGLTAGGAIIPDRLFVFGSYEGSYDHGRMATLSTVPTADMRAGNFSAIPGVSLYNPFSGFASSPSRMPLFNNTIPASMMNPNALMIANSLPLPNAPGFADNYISNPAFKNDGNRPDIRLDYRFNENTSAFLRYGYTNWMTEQESPLGSVGQNLYNRQLAHNVVADLTHTFSPSLLTDFRFGYNRFDQNIQPLGSSLLDQNGLYGNFDISGLTTLGTHPNLLSNNVDNTFNWVWNWSWHTNHHNVKFGVDVSRNRVDGFNNNLWGPLGAAIYGPGATLNSAVGFDPAASFANSFAGFLLGTPTQAGAVQFASTPTIRQTWYAGYIQDAINLSPKLVVNLGLRYDAYSPFEPAHAGGAMAYNPFANTVSYAGIGATAMDFGRNWQAKNFGPRVGFAFRPFGNRTVIRGGYSINYLQSPYQYSGWMPTMMGSVEGVNGTFGVANANGFVNTNMIASAAPTVGTAVAPNIPLNYVPTDMKTPYVQNVSFQVQRDLGANFVLSAGYVGAFGRRLPFSFEMNAALPGSGMSGMPLFAQFGRTASVMEYANGLTSNYNALQAMLMKRFSYGLSFQAAYTWSKAMGYTTPGNTLLNPFDRAANYGPVDYDRTNVLTISHLWEIPVGNGAHRINTGLLGKLLASWQLNGVFTWSSGTPLTITADPLLCNCPGINAVTANVNGPVAVTNNYGPGTTFFNTAAFTSPVNGFGNLAPGAIRGPGFRNYDLSLFKTFPFMDHYKIELRGEAYNLTNSPHPINPVTNLNAGNFGTITNQFNSTSLAGAFGRQVDFGLRILF